MLNVLYILEALRHNFIIRYLRLSLRCARWDKCNFMYRHLPDLEADISSSRLRHWLCRRMFALFCFYESLIKESSRENCWFSHDVTKIQTTKLSILLRFYFHGVLEQLKTNFHTNFRFKRVLGFVMEYA